MTVTRGCANGGSLTDSAVVNSDASLLSGDANDLAGAELCLSGYGDDDEDDDGSSRC